MSRINDGLYSSNSQCWETPPSIYEPILEFCGLSRFTIDPCTTAKNVPARFQITERENGLETDWFGLYPMEPVVFMNPPYCDLKDWVQKAKEEAENGCHVWGLFPARPDTKYWHDHVFVDNAFIVFLQGRVKFLLDGKEQGVAPFPTVLVHWSNNVHVIANYWRKKKPLKGSLVIPV